MQTLYIETKFPVPPFSPKIELTPLLTTAVPRQYNVIKSIENSSALESRASQSGASKFPSLASEDGGRLPFSSDGANARCADDQAVTDTREAGLASTSTLQLEYGVSALAQQTADARALPPSAALPQMDQLAAALDLCSDVEILLQQKYDPSVQLDRMNNIFPAEYVCSLLSRVGCVPRGRGAKERVQSAKDNGAKTQFVPIYRPKLFDLRGNRYAVEAQLTLLREDMVASSSASLALTPSQPPPTPLLHSACELGCTMVPFMQCLSYADASAGTALAPPRFPPAVSYRLDALRKASSGAQYASYSIPSAPLESDADAGPPGQLETGANAAHGHAAAVFITPQGGLHEASMDDDPIDEFD